MVKNKKIIVVLPAYNAEKTLIQTYNEIPHDIVDEIVIVDDCSNDNTVEVAKQLGIKHIIKHEKNKGYGGNQKTCYDTALSLGGDIIIMVHPDYQYTPLLIEPMAYVLANGLYPVIFGSRILGRDALKGGMPLYKYIANRILTLIENLMLGEKLTEYHTGYRAYTREVLENINYKANSDDFIFDNQITFFFGIYATNASQIKGTKWCSQALITLIFFTTNIWSYLYLFSNVEILG